MTKPSDQKMFRTQLCMPKKQHEDLKHALLVRASRSPKGKKATGVSPWVQEEAAKVIKKYR